MSHSNNQKNLDYQVLLTIKGTLPVHYEDAINRMNIYIDMIQNIKNIDNVEDIVKIDNWGTLNKVYIPPKYWQIIKDTDKIDLQQNNHNISNIENLGMNLKNIPNIEYRTLITMHGNLPIKERNTEAVTRISNTLNVLDNIIDSDLDTTDKINKIDELHIENKIYITPQLWFQDQWKEELKNPKADASIDDINLNYEVMLKIRLDLSVHERHKDAIMRLDNFTDMILSIKDKNDEYDFKKINWSDLTGVTITEPEWDQVRAADKERQTQFLNNNPLLDTSASFPYNLNNKPELYYEVFLPMKGHLPRTERNEEALRMLNESLNIFMKGDDNEINKHFNETGIYITYPSRKKIREYTKPTTHSEEKHSTFGNPHELLTDPEEKNPVNTSANQEEYTTDCIIM